MSAIIWTLYAVVALVLLALTALGAWCLIAVGIGTVTPADEQWQRAAPWLFLAWIVWLVGYPVLVHFIRR